MRTDLQTQRVDKHFRRSHEPVAWSLFGAGGMMVAFFTPSMIIVSGFLLPFVPGTDYQSALQFMQSIWVKLFVLVAIVLQLFHASHRFYHGFHDLHIAVKPPVLACFTYGSAALLSVLALALLLLLGSGA